MLLAAQLKSRLNGLKMDVGQQKDVRNQNWRHKPESSTQQHVPAKRGVGSITVSTHSRWVRDVALGLGTFVSRIVDGGSTGDTLSGVPSSISFPGILRSLRIKKGHWTTFHVIQVVAVGCQSGHREAATARWDTVDGLIVGGPSLTG